MKPELLRERYEPCEVVGRGGEGEVIRALDHLHGRQVALKVRPVLGEASRAQLLSEARLLLSLSPHPGLPLVREDFFVDERYVIAMDWIEGRDLEALLAAEGQPGLDPQLVIEYLAQAAGALGHLHTHQPPVVHGDVKPANLILTSSGRVVLVDFGLSTTPADDSRRAGSAGYVAPEVAAGAKPTAAADVYSLAATALALLTGEPPTGGAPGWGDIERERIPALERIIRSNLATDPVRRDGSAAAFVARLQRWWGAELPTGTVTLILADVDGSPEAAVDDVARAHSGRSIASAADGPVMMAFPSAQDGLAAASELACHLGARVAAVTGEAEPRAGRYPAEPASGATRLLELAGVGEVLLDDRTATAVDGRLSPEIGLAEVDGAWTVVAPGLSFPSRAGACPYRGLMAFGSEDGDLFFGREEVVASVLKRLLRSGFMAVVGASGSGKSSVVRAGIVPAFHRVRDGPAALITPGADPSTELERALSDRPSLLVVDQLEEVFTLCADQRARSRFIDHLIELREQGAASIVVALRADFYGACANHPRLATAVAEHQHLLGPMGADDLRRAIERPARAAGVRLEPGLIDAMLADVDGEPGALPLLSHALYESWVRRDGRVLSFAGYRAVGGVRGAIAHTAEQVFITCSRDEQELMRRMFLRLTELGETTEDTRRRVSIAELLSEGPDAADVLEHLASSRLLVVGDGSAEVAHEALIREWPRLRGWLAEDRDQLMTLRQLAVAARSWEEGGRDDADLYRGARLERIGDEKQLSDLDREFLAAGRDAQDRELRTAQRRARRLRALLALVAAALVIALVAAAFALIQRRSARDTATAAQAGRLAAQSREAAAQNPDLGLLLALEADRRRNSADSRGALLGALEHGSRIRAWLQGFRSPVNAVAYSPDGRLLATVTPGVTTLWNTATWRRSGQPLHSAQGDGEGVDFSPDGRTLAVAGGRGRVELWSVARRTKLRELTDPAAAKSDDPALAGVRFSPDGTIIAAGGQESNHVTLWDVASGRVIGRPITVKPPGGGAQWIAFTPDSRRIAAPGADGAVGIWDPATGRRLARLEIGKAGVADALFARSGRTLIAGDDAGSVSFVDVATGRLLRRLSIGDQTVDALALSPDERLVAAASFAGPVYVWDTKTGAAYGPPLPGGTSPGNDVAFSPDGRTLASAHVRSAVVWNMDGERAIGRPLGGPTALASDVAFTPDGRSLLAGRLDGDTAVFDVATRRMVRTIHGDAVVSAVAVSPDGRLVAIGTVDGQLRLFDRTGARVGSPLEVGTGAVWQVGFSPDGRLLAVAVDRNGAGRDFLTQPRNGEVQLWNVASRRRVGRSIRPGSGSLLALAFNRDGTLLATGSYGHRLDLWDVSTQARHGKSTYVSDEGFPSVSFDSSGRLVAAGGASGSVRVWEVAGRRPVFPALTGHKGPVTGISFDPHGSLLATTSLFGGTRLWDQATGIGYGDELISERPASLEPSGDLPAFLGVRNAFSPNGRLLATAGVDANAMLWDVDPAVWRRRACAIAGRNLTREEWRQYLPTGTPYRATCPEWPSP
jgi:WD40 repeat protein/tRNA A-37 threonylcarbamoyl transferase component Bud32